VRPFDASRAQQARHASETHKFLKISRKSFCASDVELAHGARSRARERDLSERAAHVSGRRRRWLALHGTVILGL